MLCVCEFFSFSAIVRDVTKYFSCSTRIWRFSVSISVQWFKCACVRVCVCVWATHALLIIHWIYILIQRIVSFLSLRLFLLNVCTRKMCVLWHLFISVETVREYLASKWEVRLTIYDCGMEYDSPWIELHIHILHTMRKHIYVNEARRWCLSGLSYRVYIRINITRHESNINFAFANQIVSLNQNRKKMNERKKEIKYSTSYVCVRFAFIIRKSVRGIDRWKPGSFRAFRAFVYCLTNW